MVSSARAGSGDGAASAPDPISDEARLVAVRDEIRFELGLLHDRANALLAGEAFLTIAYTAAMSDGAPWGRRFAATAAPVLAVLGLLLALLALPGVAATARIVLSRTALLEQLLERLPDTAVGGYHGITGPGSAGRDQRRGLVFFRAVPLLFAVVWIVLLVLAGVLLW